MERVDALDSLVHDALLTTAIVALPVLVAAALVGAIVAVAQAATQVQEQTLTLLPKVLTVGLMVALFGKTAMHLLATLFRSGVPGIHFYTLNRSPATRAIVSALLAASAWRPAFSTISR